MWLCLKKMMQLCLFCIMKTLKDVSAGLGKTISKIVMQRLPSMPNIYFKQILYTLNELSISLELGL